MEKIIIVTGVTGSIGKATATELARRPGIRLVLSARDAARLETLKKDLQTKNPQAKLDTLVMDLGDIHSVKKGIEEVKAKYQSIYGIVNIAAVYKTKRELSPQKNEMMFAINQLGPFQFTTGLTNHLDPAGAVVLSVTAPSRQKTDFDNINGDKKFNSLNFFGASKMHNLLFTFSLAGKFKNTSHAAVAFHPGLVKSDILREGSAFMRGMFKLMASPPGVAGEAIADLMVQGKPQDMNGKFFNKKRKEIKAVAYAYDEPTQNKLWQTCENIIQQNLN